MCCQWQSNWVPGHKCQSHPPSTQWIHSDEYNGSCLLYMFHATFLHPRDNRKPHYLSTNHFVLYCSPDRTYRILFVQSVMLCCPVYKIRRVLGGGTSVPNYHGLTCGLTHYLPTIHIWMVCCNCLPGQHKGIIFHAMLFTGNLDPNTSLIQHWTRNMQSVYLWVITMETQNFGPC